MLLKILFELFFFVFTLLYRQDLANLVRRRGYKLIKELLAASQEIEVTDSDVGLTEYKDINNEDEATGGIFCSFFTNFLFVVPFQVKIKTFCIETYILKRCG